MPYIGAQPDKGNFSDLNGAKLILDADADTSITADTDDQIDIEIAGSDELKITATMIAPATADGSALGGTSNEWSDLYLADGGVINLGTDQDVTITHDPDDGLFFKSTATADDNPFLLTLQTGETDLAANDVIGKIAFQAPDEGTGTDAILVSAAIQARAEGDHSSSSNATSIDFMTGASEAATTKVSITSAGAVDINGGELILDADADTSIHASTDDQIDFKLSGADDFRMTANNFNVLSGSTLTIDSGATITNSGTANNFGSDMESAYTGVLETNANFVDQVIFGPAVDGVPWKGLWNKASLFSSLMLATIEDEGSNTEINIWDLTEQSSGTISTTPLGTVDLSSAATPTAIAASMGYLIVSSEDGIAIIDPHSGSWAERTVGWPRTLSTSTTPALTNADVKGVATGFSDQPAHDTRTGGPMPIFWVAYGTGADVVSVLKDDGNVFDAAGTIASTGVGATNNGYAYYADSANQIVKNTAPVSAITADDWTEERIISDNNFPSGIFPGTTFDVSGDIAASGGTGGLSLISGLHVMSNEQVGSSNRAITSAITRAYNSGYMVGNITGAWLANSKTVDRSYLGNTLTENGTVPEAAVASGTELMGYGPFSTSNYLSRATDADWQSIGTGSVYTSCWFKSDGAAASTNYIMGFNKSGDSIRWYTRMENDGTILLGDDGATANVQIISTAEYDDSKWHKLDHVRVSSTERYQYIDGVLLGSSTTDAGSLSDSALPFAIGRTPHSSTQAADDLYITLARLSTTAPTATQVRQMYDAEKGMFEANAECLLQSGTTDAVLDVNVDPLSGKTLVTQTDAITIFDGLVVDSKPTVNSGNSEKGKLWGTLRAEQNSANAYVTAPAVDQRQVNEMVRGLANEVPKGVDLSKAKAWCSLDGSGTIAINNSYNIKSVTDNGTGQWYFHFAQKFKNTDYIVMATPHFTNSLTACSGAQFTHKSLINVRTTTDGNAQDVDPIFGMWFGELENE